VTKGSFLRLAFLCCVADNDHSDMTQGSQTVPSEPAKPETEPASTADKPGSEPVVASAGGTLLISIAFYAGWGGLLPPPADTLLNRTREAA
jgi:hypothetical protein